MAGSNTSTKPYANSIWHEGMDATLQWQCQDHILVRQPEGNLFDLFQMYPEPPARQRQESLARWFSELCLGIARALNDAHDSIMNRPDQGIIDSPPSFNGFRVGYEAVSLQGILFSGERKSSEALFTALYSVSKFGLRTFDPTKSVARGPRGFVRRDLKERAPEHTICKEVSLRSDIWSLGCVLLSCVIWFWCGSHELDNFMKCKVHASEETDFRGEILQKYKESVVLFPYFSLVQKQYERGGKVGAVLSSFVPFVSPRTGVN